MEKVQWNSIDKKQNGFKYSKNDKSSTLPRRCVSMEWSKAALKKSPVGLSHPNQNIIINKIL